MGPVRGGNRYDTMKNQYASIIILLLSVLPISLACGQDLRVTLLGSGETYPQPGRLGPGILVEAGEKTYLFDAGRGILQRFSEIGGFSKDLDAVFFTHLHLIAPAPLRFEP